MMASPRLSRGSRLQAGIWVEVAQGNNMTTPPIGIIRPRIAAAEVSATQMNLLPAIISNTATAGTTITTRTTGAATVTMTAEVATDITTTGVATVATKIVDGDGTEARKGFL